jgi:hypothetical protein
MAYTFYAWSYRETVSLRWAGGKIATFITPTPRPSGVVMAADAQGDVRVSESLIGARHYVSTSSASLIVDNTNPYFAQIGNASDIPVFLDRREQTNALVA